MSGRHSTPPRGLDATRSELFQGRFGRMFRTLRPARFGATEAANIANLTALGEAMSAPLDKPKDGGDEEESGIPALYTYFGQFIDHDLTFDPVSLLTKSRDPDGLVDFRTPAFDLDNVYGRGPADQPYMYDGLKFRLGEALHGAGVPDASDLPRFGGRAIIGDPRNDENSIVSQLQGLFLRFHNRFVDENPALDFHDVQRKVRFHYQYMVVNDFLPKIVQKPVLDGLQTHGHYDLHKLRYFHWRHDPFMPVEFAVAAYRLGHSMVRPGYRLNDAKLLPIFPVPDQGLPEGLTGFQTMADGRAIDWGRFIDVETRAFDGPDGSPEQSRRLQFAYRIDPSLVNPLAHLPKEVAGDDPASLAGRNLIRSWRLGLPSGQDVARAMGVRTLHDSEIVIGKAMDAGDTDAKPIAQIAGGAFAGKCPLWTYILAEAAQHRVAMPISPTGGPASVSTPQLGPVGGRIVAEVFLGLLFGDNLSYLSEDPHWVPATGAGFSLKSFVSYALGHGPQLH